MEKTDEFQARFGERVVEYSGLLVVGKDDFLGEKEARRLKWRQEKVLINSNKLVCVTFNQLCDNLSERLGVYENQFGRRH